MVFSRPATELIRERFSCRTYEQRPIAEEERDKLAGYLLTIPAGPFGNRPRFELVAATDQDRSALRGLGTYGFIKGATGFIIGAVEKGAKNLEDFGYLMELAILHATDLGLGTCWLGGTFTKSSFSRKIGLRRGESIPAVAAVGYVADRRAPLDVLARRTAGGERRLPWEELFLQGPEGACLSQTAAGAYAIPLEMVRLGPSASNRQPWRILEDGDAWHFYLQRTPTYRASWLVGIADMQRIDMGIAMSHFELAANEIGLQGRWESREPALATPAGLTEYIVSWVTAAE